MFDSGLAEATRKNLEILKNISFIQQFYLAGGTAVALYIGHRRSFDLDFFSERSFDIYALRLELEEVGAISDRVEVDTFLGRMNNEKISFFKYSYPAISPAYDWNGIAIASKEDLIAMKVDAISNRGAKRDFMDLYVLCSDTGLSEAISMYEKKYKTQGGNLPHILRSLVYFVDAEDDPELEMLKNIKWEVVKKFFEKETEKLAKEVLM